MNTQFIPGGLVVICHQRNDGSSTQCTVTCVSPIFKARSLCVFLAHVTYEHTWAASRSTWVLLNLGCSR